MSIKYQLRKQTVNAKSGKEVIYFAMPVSNGETSIEQLQKMIARISAVSEGDVRSVLLTLTQLVALELEAGRRVSLGDLGRMRIGMRSRGAKSAEAFTTNDIRRLRVTFTPGRLIKEGLSTASLERMLGRLGKGAGSGKAPSTGDSEGGTNSGNQPESSL